MSVWEDIYGAPFSHLFTELTMGVDDGFHRFHSLQ